MQISASMVKELRERTGSGMMECKKALQETDGDIETAIENMRKSGLAKADKKSGRIAAEGVVLARTNADNNKAIILEAKKVNNSKIAAQMAGVHISAFDQHF